MTLKPDHAKLAAYFNLDNGTGKIRGIYLQENSAVKPVFESWMAAVEDLGAKRITMRNTGGTDHQSFDAVGLPGFQFIQDPIEYEGGFFATHHTDMDVYDRLQREDLMQAAVVIATFAYTAANRDEPLPRKPLPPVAPRAGPGGGQGSRARRRRRARPRRPRPARAEPGRERGLEPLRLRNADVGRRAARGARRARGRAHAAARAAAGLAPHLERLPPRVERRRARTSSRARTTSWSACWSRG